MNEDLIDTDSATGLYLGTILAALTFAGAWIYCMAEYGFLLGFGLGWLPSAILAAMVFGVGRYLWRVVGLIVAVIVLIAIIAAA